MTRYIGLAEYVWLAEQVTGVEVTVLAKASRIDLADSACTRRPPHSATMISTQTSTTRPLCSAAASPGTTPCPTATSARRGRRWCCSSISTTICGTGSTRRRPGRGGDVRRGGRRGRRAMARRVAPSAGPLLSAVGVIVDLDRATRPHSADHDRTDRPSHRRGLLTHPPRHTPRHQPPRHLHRQRAQGVGRCHLAAGGDVLVTTEG